MLIMRPNKFKNHVDHIEMKTLLPNRCQGAATIEIVRKDNFGRKLDSQLVDIVTKRLLR